MYKPLVNVYGASHAGEPFENSSLAWHQRLSELKVTLDNI